MEYRPERHSVRRFKEMSNTKLLFLWTEYISFVPPGAFVSFILILGQIDEGKLRRKIYCTNRKGKIYQRKLHLKF